MRELTRRFLAAAGLGTVAVAAVAQPMGPGMMGGGRGMMGGGPGMMGRGMGPQSFADAGAYLDGVKAQLGITEAQAGAWKTYADAVVGAWSQMQTLHQSMWESMPTATWEERRDMMNRAFQARQQAFQSVHDAALALMPVLSERQQGRAEVILPGLARRGWGGMGRR